ncbi:hypothetical protein V1511DRAFT_512524 [Dipodascopsis uninucleata]
MTQVQVLRREQHEKPPDTSSLFADWFIKSSSRLQCTSSTEYIQISNALNPDLRKDSSELKTQIIDMNEENTMQSAVADANHDSNSGILINETETMADEAGSIERQYCNTGMIQKGTNYIDDEEDVIVVAIDEYDAKVEDDEQSQSNRTSNSSDAIDEDNNDGEGRRYSTDTNEDESDENEMTDPFELSSSPSIGDESDINYDLVYAFRTFEATVAGHANAVKGDAMVLLDDSNEYWWLVRMIKDSSIGFLPAETIETPTERLARLNKHRNADLSAFTDDFGSGTAVKESRSLLRRFRSRKTKEDVMTSSSGLKSVSFTAPTYYDPPEGYYIEDSEQEADDEADDETDDEELDDNEHEDEEDNDLANHKENTLKCDQGDRNSNLDNELEDIGATSAVSLNDNEISSERESVDVLPLQMESQTRYPTTISDLSDDSIHNDNDEDHDTTLRDEDFTELNSAINAERHLTRSSDPPISASVNQRTTSITRSVPNSTSREPLTVMTQTESRNQGSITSEQVPLAQPLMLQVTTSSLSKITQPQQPQQPQPPQKPVIRISPVSSMSCQSAVISQQSKEGKEITPVIAAVQPVYNQISQDKNSNKKLTRKTRSSNGLLRTKSSVERLSFRSRLNTGFSNIFRKKPSTQNLRATSSVSSAGNEPVSSIIAPKSIEKATAQNFIASAAEKGFSYSLPQTLQLSSSQIAPHGSSAIGSFETFVSRKRANPISSVHSDTSMIMQPFSRDNYKYETQSATEEDDTSDEQRQFEVSETLKVESDDDNVSASSFKMDAVNKMIPMINESESRSSEEFKNEGDVKEDAENDDTIGPPSYDIEQEVLAKQIRSHQHHQDEIEMNEYNNEQEYGPIVKPEMILEAQQETELEERQVTVKEQVVVEEQTVLEARTRELDKENENKVEVDIPQAILNKVEVQKLLSPLEEQDDSSQVSTFSDIPEESEGYQNSSNTSDDGESTIETASSVAQDSSSRSSPPQERIRSIVGNHLIGNEEDEDDIVVLVTHRGDKPASIHEQFLSILLSTDHQLDILSSKIDSLLENCLSDFNSRAIVTSTIEEV